MKLKTLLTDTVSAPSVPDLEITHITNDSRHVCAGSLFIAIPGLKTDGRHYIDEAISKGALAIVYQADAEPLLIQQNKIPMIAVEKLAEYQGDIAARFYNQPSKEMQIIGVTGTNGKTSCTHFIAQALAQHAIKTAVLGTVGSGFIGDLKQAIHTTPDVIHLQQTLAELKKQGAKAVAMEVSSHALAQHRVRGVDFNIAVLTQLSRDHLDYHETMQHYANAKEKLFQQPGLAYAIVNLDDPLGEYVSEKYADQLEIIGYSALGKKHSQQPSVFVEQVKSSESGFEVSLQSPWGAGTFITPLLGRFNIGNLLAVLSVLAVLEVPFTKALHYLSLIKTVIGRMQCFGGDGQPRVVVDYSHTSDALKNALIALREHCLGKLWCVFGCGGNRDRGKRSLMGAISEQYSDYVVITNDNPRHEDPKCIIDDICKGLKDASAVVIEENRAKAITYAIEKAGSNDIVLVAGKGHESGIVMADKTIPFSDIEQVSICLAKWG